MNNLDTLLQMEISGREKLLWSGRPKQGLKFSAIDWFLIPFSILWLLAPIGMLIAGEENVQNNSGLPFLVIPLIFLCIGGYVLFGRFIHDAFRRKKTIYGLTDKRVIFISKSGIKSVPINEAVEIHFKENRKSRSTIQFGASPSLFSSSGNHPFNLLGGAPIVPTFEQIENGTEVYKMIKKQMSL
ncbi:hypothetical protein [Kordiimonas sp. SCSIO 12610]|uniref:hypothetical protein n=1 Tax=Kordiimonas sp. SCSIO 12610 TaxID=2829597 RepID=UPI00210E7014|nr:hypothetical protein [Kordiimonas sp. SCSIO 12610]UTW56696.1 hypothetical protein KFF44_07355 [Kordiimonas sp. SCSIO 12610]